ncbi:MAG: response regulator [Chlorobiaceae bacterium]|nr:response regulator [Chlorobiaceae bacterium]NTW10977.1 response regulator [Chlorobiaceae bacterium]
MNSGGKSILLADDQPNSRRLIGYILNKAGYTVAEAGNGIEALEYCIKNPPGLILCDIMMPGMNGMQFRLQLLQREELRDIPFIFLTARAQAHEMVEGEQLVPQAYITKPVEPNTILQIVGKYLKPSP